jgi:hypothetical protein
MKNKIRHIFYLCLLSVIYLIFFSFAVQAEGVISNTIVFNLKVKEPHPYNIQDRFEISVDSDNLQEVLSLLDDDIKNLRARVFRGSADKLKDTEQMVQTKDKCMLYPSRSFTIHVSNGKLIMENCWFLPDWLKYKDGRFEDEAYLLVFEFSNSNGNFIKIKPKDVEKYFNNGHPFKVKAPLKPFDEKEIKKYLQKYKYLSEESDLEIKRIKFDTNEERECNALVRFADNPNSITFATLTPVRCNN